MSYSKEILDNYDNSFVNDYAKWSILVDEVNSFIPIYLESMNLGNQYVKEFEYNEFCVAYKAEVENYLIENKRLDKESVHYILDLLVKKRIIHYLAIDSDIE
jgi:hypothetical protein